MSKYIIYGKENCVYCTAAKHLLSRCELDWEYLDIADPSNYYLFRADFMNAKTVPQIMHGKKNIGGYRELRLHLGLDPDESMI